MTNPTPTPRLVPDRPSDAEIACTLREIVRKRNRGKLTVKDLCDAVLSAADQIDAAAPPAEAPAERGDVNVLDVGFKYENGVHTPTVLVGFKPNDWATRDRFAANVNALAAAPAAPAEGAKWAKRLRAFAWRLDASEQDEVGALAKFLEAPRVTGGREDAVERGAEAFWNMGPRGVTWAEATHYHDEFRRISRTILQAANGGEG